MMLRALMLSTWWLVSQAALGEQNRYQCSYYLFEVPATVTGCSDCYVPLVVTQAPPASSVFWAGRGASAEAATMGTTIAKTPIGAILNGLGVENRLVWGAAAATFAANASGTATAVIRYVAPESLWLVERAILNWRGIPSVLH